MTRLIASLLSPLPLISLGAALALAAVAPAARADACGGVPTCRDLGPFTASVVRVNVTRQDRTTAYQGVRTTVRFTNVSRQPLVLGYRDHSSSVTDNNGLAYRWSSKAEGIGVVGRGSADAQFRLAPGESRDAAFEGVLQYSLRRQVAGNVFSHDITIVQLVPVSAVQVRELRDHVVSFSNLSAGNGLAAATPPARDAGPGPTQEPSLAPRSTMPPVAGRPGGDCPATGACQATGPLVANVVGVNVTRSGNVTAYQTVRATVRFTNASDEPLILAYRQGSGAVSDETGRPYRWGFKAYGIGVVERNGADPQFRLAPGESREAAFEATQQYDARGVHPGNVFTWDMTMVQLAVVGVGQVRTLHDYALGFSNLRGSAGGSSAEAAPDVARAVNQVADLLKGLKR